MHAGSAYQQEVQENTIHAPPTAASHTGCTHHLLFPHKDILPIITSTLITTETARVVGLLVATIHNHIIDLKNHLYHLGGKLNLLHLADESLEN